MTLNLPNIEHFFEKKDDFKNERDELIKKTVEHINELRKNTPYCKCIETPAKLARRINMNVFLAGNKNNSELRLLLEECRKKNSYAKLYYTLTNKK